MSGWPNYKAIANIAEYSGVDTTNYLGQTATAVSTNPPGTGTMIETPQKNDLLIGSILTYTNGLNLRVPQTGFKLLDGRASGEWALAHLYTTGSIPSVASALVTNPYGPTILNTGCIATFKSSSGSGITPTPTPTPTTTPTPTPTPPPTNVPSASYRVGVYDNGVVFYQRGSTITTDTSGYASRLINQAMADVNAFGGVNAPVLTLYNGTLFLNETIIPRSNVYVNQTTVVTQPTISSLNNSISLVMSTGAIQNFTWNGNNNLIDGNCGSLSDHRGSNTWNNNFYKYFGIAIYTDAQSTGITIKNVLLQSIIGQGIIIRTPVNCLIQNCTVRYAGDNPISLDGSGRGPNSNSVIEYCTVVGGQDVGINTWLTSGVTIRFCSVSSVTEFGSDASHWGIAAEGTNNVSIYNNTVYGCSYNIVSTSNNVLIANNTITGSPVGDNAGIQLQTSRWNIVANNTIRNCQYPLMTWGASQTRDAQWLNNIVTDTTGTARCPISGTNMYFSGGSIQSSNVDGCISLRSAVGATFTGIKFIGSYGIMDYGQASRDTFIQNCNFAEVNQQFDLSHSTNTTFQGNIGMPAGYCTYNIAIVGRGTVAKSNGNQSLSSIVGNAWQFRIGSTTTFIATATTGFTFRGYTFTNGTVITTNTINSYNAANNDVTVYFTG